MRSSTSTLRLICFLRTQMAGRKHCGQKRNRTNDPGHETRKLYKPTASDSDQLHVPRCQDASDASAAEWTLDVSSDSKWSTLHPKCVEICRTLMNPRLGMVYDLCLIIFGYIKPPRTIMGAQWFEDVDFTNDPNWQLDPQRRPTKPNRQVPSWCNVRHLTLAPSKSYTLPLYQIEAVLAKRIEADKYDQHTHTHAHTYMVRHLIGM
jgi:hypothetical protein